MNNKNELLQALDSMKQSAMYGIFSQQCLQKYFKLKIDSNIPFELPGLILQDNTHLSLDEFISNVKIPT